MRLQGKVALVSGGGSGIGAATAVLFAREGARVAVFGRTAAKLAETVATIRAGGGEAIAVEGDSAVPEDAERAVRSTLAAFSGLDVVFLNAGSYRRGLLADTAPADFEATFRDNVTSAYVLARAALPELVRRGAGVLLFNASTVGLRPVPGVAAYAAAKAAVAMLARSVAVEYGRDGIRSLCIAPGIVDTPIHDPFVPPGERRARLEEVSRIQPLARVGTPDDVARMALFLASDEAAWVTGDVLTVDGGIALV